MQNELRQMPKLRHDFLQNALRVDVKSLVNHIAKANQREQAKDHEGQQKQQRFRQPAQHFDQHEAKKRPQYRTKQRHQSNPPETIRNPMK